MWWDWSTIFGYQFTVFGLLCWKHPEGYDGIMGNEQRLEVSEEYEKPYGILFWSGILFCSWILWSPYL